MSAIDDIGKLKVAELRAELQSRGLDSKGVKATLLDRLREAIEGENTDKDSEDDVPEKIEEEELQDETSVKETDEAQKIKEPEEIVPESEPSETTEDQLVQEDKTVPQEENGLEHHEVSENIPSKDEIATEDQKKEDAVEDSPMKDVDDDSIKKEESEEVADVKAEEETKVEQEEETEVKQVETEVKQVETEVKQVETEVKQEETEVKQEETEVKQEETEDAADVKMEGVEVKAESEDDADKRGTKRTSNDPNQNDSKRSRQDQMDEPRVEDEPEIDMSVVALDWYNSDLSLTIDKETRLSASPMVIGGFAYMWHGVRAMYGAKSGKVFYEVKILENLEINVEEDEQHTHVVRVGWSVDSSQLTLGEEPLSYGYGGTGKASTNLKFKSYGKAFGKGDVIGCFLDMDSSPMTMCYTVNGENQGICFEVNGEDLGDKALFPHILTKNSSFKVNFGSEEQMFEPLTDYTFIGKIPIEELVLGSQGPEKREDAEIIMMVGLPAAGKTTWTEKYCKENSAKRFNVLGTNNLIDRMKVMGLPRKGNYSGRWDQLIEKCTKCLNKLLYVAGKRRRNYILDQTNVYPSAQKRKIKGFSGYKRRAVVCVPTDEELKSRSEKREGEEGKDVPDKAVLEMKANFKLPEVGEWFDEVEFIELQKDEALELQKKYNAEGEKAGFGPKNHSSGGAHQQGRRVGYIDRRGKYNNNRGGSGGGSYRGGWDRDRDRRGNFDRRDRGGWNRDRGQRGGGGGGNFNKDRRGGGWGGGGGGGGYKGNQGKSSDSWGQGGYNNQGWGGQQGYNQSWGGQGGGYNSGYNWNQQYYGQSQQAQQQPQQQQQQQYWSPSGTGYSGGSQYSNVNYGGTGYGSSSNTGTGNYSNYSSQQQMSSSNQQPQWGGYNQQQQQQGYGSSGNYSSNVYRK